MLGFLGPLAAMQIALLDPIPRAAKNVGVPEELLRAICTVESSMNPKAYAHADGGAENHSFGLCQISYKTAKGLGLTDKRCLKDYRSKPKLGCRLFDPYLNAEYSAMYLKSQLERYEGSWILAAAAYNAGSVKICKSGKVFSKIRRRAMYSCRKGGLLNQRYVDKVLKELNK